jgi:hypothetical protein
MNDLSSGNAASTVPIGNIYCFGGGSRVARETEGVRLILTPRETRRRPSLRPAAVAVRTLGAFRALPAKARKGPLSVLLCNA